jgi:Flp pilus assembly pilin Flp
MLRFCWRVSLRASDLWKDRKGQDMIEYALLAAALVVIVAGYLPQDVMPMVSNVFSKISSALAKTPTGS